MQGNALGLGVSCPDGVASVGMQVQAKIPSIDAMGHPAVMHTWFFMNDDVHTRGEGNGGTIEVKRAMQLCPGGQLGVEMGAMQEV